MFFILIKCLAETYLSLLCSKAMRMQSLDKSYMFYMFMSKSMSDCDRHSISASRFIACVERSQWGYGKQTPNFGCLQITDPPTKIVVWFILAGNQWFLRHTFRNNNIINNNNNNDNDHNDHNDHDHDHEDDDDHDDDDEDDNDNDNDNFEGTYHLFRCTPCVHDTSTLHSLQKIWVHHHETSPGVIHGVSSCLKYHPLKNIADTWIQVP